VEQAYGALASAAREVETTFGPAAASGGAR